MSAIEFVAGGNVPESPRPIVVLDASMAQDPRAESVERKLEASGYVVVWASKPDAVRVVHAETLLPSSDLALAAVRAIHHHGGDATKSRFIFEVLQAMERAAEGVGT